MPPTALSPLKRLGLMLLLTAALAACSGAGTPTVNGSKSLYPLEPIFAEFYDFLGGEARLGPVISPGILDGSVQRQYTRSALLVYDPGAPPSQRYSLAPVGRDLGVWDEPLDAPNLPGVLFVEGYIVYEGFVPLYEQLGGQRYVGKPLTGVRYLQDQNRVEQYFENLGFYLNLNEREQGVQLMSYGRLACADTCGAAANPAAIIQIELPYGEPFTGTVSLLGDGFVGTRLAGPYQTEDGGIEVIYTNLVLYARGDDSQQAAPRPILALLGVSPDGMATRLDNPNLIFFGISGDLGYNVPVVFSDYIAQHGGFEAFGQPIQEIQLQDDGGFTQCFANACLRYHRADGRVAPLPMGQEYKERFFDQPGLQVAEPIGQIQILVWEDHSQISSAEQQVIHASVYAGRELLAGMQPYLSITLPEGGTSLYQFPPTDANGQTQLSVPAITAPNSTLIAYQVCLEGLDVGKVCATESFMIWGNP
jgi:hypothetical protein